MQCDVAGEFKIKNMDELKSISQELLDKNGHYKKLYDIQFGDAPQQ